jgi:hypothetical protein
MDMMCPPAWTRRTHRIEHDPMRAKWRNSLSVEKNIQAVKDFFAAIGDVARYFLNAARGASEP